MPVAVPGPADPDEDEPTWPRYEGPALLSYGFRPFFLAAALFAGLAVPIWVWLYVQASGADFLYPPRDWHVHEMLFGFLPAVMSGFLLTAVPNWTGRAPLRGAPLLAMVFLWLVGRLLLAFPWPTPVVAAVVDGAYLVALASLLWRELALAGSWGQAPVAGLISLYAVANGLFHALALAGSSTALAERLVLAVLLLLIAVIGGRLTPNFTREWLGSRPGAPELPTFTRFDVGALLLLALASVSWIVWPVSPVAGWLLVAAGAVHLVRLGRWRGWLAWREPLVLVLHLGYGWLALAMMALGGALLGFGLTQASALHVLTAGAVGTMTLAVMTRASLGHTGRARHAGSPTVAIYLLVSVGALLRVLVPSPEAATSLTHVWLGLSALGWSGGYLLFALVYGPSLLRPSLDE